MEKQTLQPNVFQGILVLQNENKDLELDIVAAICNPCAWEIEAGGSEGNHIRGLRPAWIV